MKDIHENNKLIAEFIDHIYNEDHLDILEFHSSWDWLMPVIEEIQSLDETDHNYGVIIDISTTKTSIWADHEFYFEIESDSKNRPFDIQSVYKAVIEFIKWHNDKNSK